MAYNLTFMETSNNIMDTLNGVNNIVPGLYSAFFLGALFIILMGSFKDRNYNNLLVMSSFVTSIVAALMFAINLIGAVHLIVPIIVLIASIIMKLWAGD